MNGTNQLQKLNNFFQVVVKMTGKIDVQFLATMLVALVIFLVIVGTFVFYLIKSKKYAAELKAVNERLQKQVKLSEEYHHASETDMLTGILNRGGGEKRIRMMIAEGKYGLFGLFDIDNFKRINDTYGHEKGDEILKKITGCFRDSFRENDILMRLGGDEFAFFLEGIQSESAADKRLSVFADAISRKNCGDIFLSVSIGGIISCKARPYSFEKMYRLADCMMYRCKNSDKKYMLYSFENEMENGMDIDIVEQLKQENFWKTDELTGLLRKQYFYNETRELVLKNPQKHYTLVRFDLNRFRFINDTMGFRVGDKLLCSLGEAMQSDDEIRKYTLLLGHCDADNFIACYDSDTICDVDFCKTIQERLSRRFPEYNLTFCFGFCNIDNPEIEIEIYSSRAKIALRSIKGNYEKYYAWFEVSMSRTLENEQTLSSVMEKALVSGEFEPYFQPQVNGKTGEVVGAEALVRWNYPGKGVLPPAEYIPYFEKCGFIYNMDKNIWEQTCAKMREWLDKGIKIPHVSVNVSRKDLLHVDFVEVIKGMVEKYNLSPDLIHLECTESAFLSDEGIIIGVQKKLKEVGFVLEMDDFGSGYSSLNLLKDVPIDTLKLDMKFLMKRNDSLSRGEYILRAIVNMAHSIGLPVIAEGVENEEQAEFLKDVGCFYMQGYYFSEPLSATDFEKYLIKKANDL